jgi:hypothetical protein
MSLIVDGTTGVTFNDSSLQGAAASPYVLKNRIINGDMRIDQRNAGASVTQNASSSVFPVDRFIIIGSVTSKFTAQQNAGSVTPPAGFTNYLGITSSSAYSVTGNDAFQVYQVIEGYNVADLGWGTANAQACTLSFWVRSSLTGTFGGSIATTKTAVWVMPFSYTISSANTWTFITVSITAPTSTGGTNNDNSSGVFVRFGLGSSGTATGGTAGTWTNAGNYIQPSGTTSVVGTNGATWYITGVQLEQNTSATPFERRLYNQELANCQRYYHQITGGGTNTFSAVGIGLVASATLVTAYYSLPVAMRTAPTLNYSGSIYLDCGNGSTTVTSVGTTYGGTTSCWSVLNGSGGGLTAGRAANVYCGNATTNYFTFSSEL